MKHSARIAVIGLMVTCLLTIAVLAPACSEDVPASSTTTVAADPQAGRLLAIQSYVGELENWAIAFIQDADVHSLDGFQNPMGPTEEEIAAAREFSAYASRKLSELRRIAPPAEVARAHSQYVESIAAEIIAFNRLLLGLEAGNERDLELAFRDVSAARVKEIQALEVLSPYIDLPALGQS